MQWNLGSLGQTTVPRSLMVHHCKRRTLITSQPQNAGMKIKHEIFKVHVVLSIALGITNAGNIQLLRKRLPCSLPHPTGPEVRPISQQSLSMCGAASLQAPTPHISSYRGTWRQNHRSQQKKVRIGEQAETQLKLILSKIVFYLAP